VNAYYNEIDPHAAQWLRNLIRDGHIAPGVVDERDVRDVRPADIEGFTQCHFFAGVGIWSHALRSAGWRDGKPIWTASCPCQPFSAAGAGLGIDDERHLWPVVFELIKQCRPPLVLGEQVSSAAGTQKQSGNHENLQKMSNREAHELIRQEWERRAPMGMQELYGGEPEARQISREEICFGLSAQAQSQGFDPTRQAEGGKAQFGFQFDEPFTGNSGANRSRPLRSDGADLEFGWWENVGQPVARQARPEGRLSNRKPSSGLPRSEQRDGGLGRKSYSKDGGGNNPDTQGAFGEAFDAACREHQEANGHCWFDIVSFQMEQAHYAIGACDAPAAGFGAPHIRQRLYFAAENQRPSAVGLDNTRCVGRPTGRDGDNGRHDGAEPEPNRTDGGMGDTIGAGLERHAGYGDGSRRRANQARSASEADILGGMADADCDAGAEHEQEPGQRSATQPGNAAGRENAGHRPAGPGPTNGPWEDADWLHCRDGKWRPAQSSPQPLVDGSARSLGFLCADACKKAKEEIDATTMEAEGGRNKALRDLRDYLVSQAKPEWPLRGVPGLHEAPFLLAFVRQLAQQGWDFEECLLLPRSKDEEFVMSCMWSIEAIAGASHRLGLDKQRPTKYPDIVHKLSSILAQNARETWGFAHGTYAEIGFPLTVKGQARVGRLRAYGNGLCAAQATGFIRAYMERDMVDLNVAPAGDLFEWGV